MATNNLYSKRKKLAEQANQPEVYQYINLPPKFRCQVTYIWLDAIGYYHAERVMYGDPLVNRLWRAIHDFLARELGLFNLGNEFQNPFEKCKAFFLNEDTPVDHLLDLIEITFRCIDQDIRKLLRDPRSSRELEVIKLPDDAISELNSRFFEHSIGYQYNSGQIICVNSGLIHAEIVVPALSLLSSQQFKGAEQEFQSAHKHYKKREYKEAILDAAKAFESVMKIICDECGWLDKQFGAKDLHGANDLINVVFKNELLPKYLQTQLSELRSLLVSGVPKVRNITSAHGQGKQPIPVPEYLAAYVLHLTASNIVLLVEAYKVKQSNLV
jgi:5'(3')-deoxyribonucleotidase